MADPLCVQQLAGMDLSGTADRMPLSHIHLLSNLMESISRICDARDAFRYPSSAGCTVEEICAAENEQEQIAGACLKLLLNKEQRAALSSVLKNLQAEAQAQTDNMHKPF